MTARGLFEGALVELSKVNAPPLMIEDFNYFINKAFNQFINKSYNLYDVNQQYSDNLRVLKSTATLPAKKSSKTSDSEGLYDSDIVGNLHEATYEVELPQDYLHLLNCVCYFKLLDNDKCHRKDSVMAYSAKRLTADSWSVVLNNFYTRPTPQRPYYYIHNVNTSTSLPTNPYSDTNKQGTDFSGNYRVGTEVNYKDHILNNITDYVCYKQTEDGPVIIENMTIADLASIDYVYTYNAEENADLKVSNDNSNFPRIITLGGNP